MTDVRTFRATDPADLLALVPGLLGFHPERSVVLMTVGSLPEPVHVRVDLPTTAVAVEDLARHLAALAVRARLRELVLVVYSGDAGLAEAVLESVGRRLQQVGTDVLCAVRAHEDRWWWIGAPADAPGMPYDARSHPFMTQLVVDGTVVLGSRRELAATLEGTDPEETARIAALLRVSARGYARAAAPTAGRRRLREEGRWVGRRVRRFLADGLPLDETDVARMAAATCASVEVRDVAWAEMTRADAPRHVDLWRDLVRRVPVGHRFAPATLLGFAAWLAGHGALAWCAVDKALESRDDYRLARLLGDVLDRGVPPSAWSPLTREAQTLFDG